MLSDVWNSAFKSTCLSKANSNTNLFYRRGVCYAEHIMPSRKSWNTMKSYCNVMRHGWYMIAMEDDLLDEVIAKFRGVRFRNCHKAILSYCIGYEHGDGNVRVQV